MNKTELLGRAKESITATFDHIIDRQKLNQPLPVGMVVYIFCQGCGCLDSLNESEARTLLALLDGPPTVASFSGLYFHAQACPHCDSQNSQVELKKISS